MQAGPPPDWYDDPWRQARLRYWDGTTWNVIPNTIPDSELAELDSVDALSANDIWAVGSYEEANTYTYKALTEHWDGTTWHVVNAANVQDSSGIALDSVSAISSNDIWAVGAANEYEGYYGLHAIVEHYSTDCIPLNCRISFSDVQPSDYFYYPVLYLSCRGVVSGYDDNTYRPGNTATRAQVSKIIVNAEGWTLLDPFEEHFVDVPYWDPFYQYIETAYAHGIVSGYSCGTDCLEFRPSNNVTRSQLAKVIVSAEEWSIYMPPTPTFVDVPANNPFYGYIETAYNHGIISGYSCGSGCLAYHPGNSATRGQIAKIVYTAVTQP